MKNLTKASLFTLLLIITCHGVQAQNTTNSLFSKGQINSADVPAGEAGRYYLPGAAASRDAVKPSSYSKQFKIGARFKAGWSLSACSSMNFYQNIQAELKNLQYKLKKTVKNAQKTMMSSISGAITSYFQYALMKINPTLGQLTTKTFDETLDLFNLQVKQCQDFEKDARNGKNPLSELGQIAIGEQWSATIKMVNDGKIALEAATEEQVKEANKKGIPMADGKNYGGAGQEPINITKNLLVSGMNLVLARTNKAEWENPFPTDAETVKNNPILSEFKSPKDLYSFVEDVYGSTETKLAEGKGKEPSVKTTPGKGYEKKYVEYRNEYLPILRQYVNAEIDRKTFENKTHDIIPPAEIDDIRRLAPYARSVEIEARAQQYAIKRMRQNLIFAKQALKTGIYAPDLQKSSIKAPAEREYKAIYYRILDDIAEIGQRAYQY